MFEFANPPAAPHLLLTDNLEPPTTAVEPYIPSKLTKDQLNKIHGRSPRHLGIVLRETEDSNAIGPSIHGHGKRHRADEDPIDARKKKKFIPTNDERSSSSSSVDYGLTRSYPLLLGDPSSPGDRQSSPLGVVDSSSTGSLGTSSLMPNRQGDINGPDIQGLEMEVFHPALDLSHRSNSEHLGLNTAAQESGSEDSPIFSSLADTIHLPSLDPLPTQEQIPHSNGGIGTRMVPFTALPHQQYTMARDVGLLASTRTNHGVTH